MASLARRTELVVIGASAGGIDALSDLLRALPEDLPAAVMVVMHLAASSPSLLPHILARATELAVEPASDGSPIEPGHVYVATPDLHLLVDDGTMRQRPTARVNGHRPAVDPLFISAAEAYGDRLAAVILSGTRDDGTIGMARVKAKGGRCLVQDPDEARHDGMPRSAIEHVPVDAILPARELGAALDTLARTGELAGTPAGNGGAPPPRPAGEDPLITVCPDCGGVLNEVVVDGVSQFNCHVGHTYSPRALAERQGATVEQALWTAVRTLEDREALLTRLAEQNEARGRHRSAIEFHRQAEVASRQADRVRDAIGELTVTARLGDSLADVEAVEG